MCLRFSSSSKSRWFTLCRRPTRSPNSNPNPNRRLFTPCFRPQRTLKNTTRKEETRRSNNLMVSVPTRNFSIVHWRNHAVIGSDIYIIGRYLNSKLSSARVFFLDCRSYTWHEAPSMRTRRNCPNMSAIDGKIHVVEKYGTFVHRIP